ncbi:hypothetical protein CLV24_103181 [Pontibacter ummariensis]|uniref:Uncharacterized protein n=1 Tax=Pontibacter ummariensis TaxID=1610492 RepID=A0A239CLR5_9BACT|nr:hypothetical protein [Pontibacter ummariensis]PRY14942.1 hypothetical protein CLV24_103181 [Pontibacter ummariensis]SNS21087.1 hypothetical protein SAMN06296052_103132 [Pontibacter ummariensis]
MKIPAIKKLVENYTLEELMAAEAAIVDEQQLAIEVEGEDEGEQLTHVLAAVWILNEMEDNGTEFKAALRQYTQKVRTSIS